MKNAFHCARCFMEEEEHADDPFPLEAFKKMPFLHERNDGFLIWRYYRCGGPGCRTGSGRASVLCVVAPFRTFASEASELQAPPFVALLTICKLRCEEDECENPLHAIAALAGRIWCCRGHFSATGDLPAYGPGTFSMQESYWRDIPEALQHIESRRYGPARIVLLDEGGKSKDVKGFVTDDSFPEDVRLSLIEHMTQKDNP